jgi:hypothetical protein
VQLAFADDQEVFTINSDGEFIDVIHPHQRRESPVGDGDGPTDATAADEAHWEDAQIEMEKICILGHGLGLPPSTKGDPWGTIEEPTVTFDAAVPAPMPIPMPTPTQDTF